MAITIKTQNYGVEIELTGITREKAASIIAGHFGTTHSYAGSSYSTWEAKDRKNRTWKCMSDASIECQKKVGNRMVSASRDYSCEVVTPILQYEDMDDLQEIVRKLRAAGAIANSSTGIHVHVDGANHTPASLTRLVNYFVGRQDLFYEALEIGERANRWCRKMNPTLLKAMKHTDKNRNAVEQVWYSDVNDQYSGGIDHSHYNQTRYHGANLHAFFTKGTVEFRLFNGTTHAGRIKAYVQFCLAMSAWAINCEKDRLFFKDINGYTKAQKKEIMTRMLTRRLGLNGKEFETCRYFLTRAFDEPTAA